MEYKQFGLNLYRFRYIIEANGITVIKKKLAQHTETFIEFEDIGSKIIKDNSRRIGWLIASAVFLLLAIAVFFDRVTGGKVGKGAEIFWVCVSIILFIVFVMTRKQTVYLAQSDNTNAIEFIGSKRYKDSLAEFTRQLLAARDKFLLDKYSTLDDMLPYNQQYNNLVWLYNLKLLNKEQLQSKIDELDALPTTRMLKTDTTTITGFGQRYIEDEEEDEEDDE